LNILVISQFFWPENFRINQLSRHLSKKNKVIVLTGKPSYPNKDIFLKFKKIDRYGKTKIIRVPTLPRGNNSLFLFLSYLSFIILSIFYALVISFNKRIDKIIVFGTSPPNGLIAAHILKIFKNIPIYYWILDLWPNTLAGLGISKKNVVYKIINTFMDYNYRNCRYIFCQSISIKNIISKKIELKDTLIYFPSWSEKLPFIKKKVLSKKISNKKFKIMFTGNIGEAQDFESIIKSAKILKNESIQWIIVGSGRYRAKIEYLIRKNNLIDCFVFIEHQKPIHIKYLISLSDCLLVTLKKSSVFSKTIPGKLSNYMDSKMPVIGMIDGETNNIINKSKCGFASKAGDYKHLAQIILKMRALHPKKRKLMGVKGYFYSSIHFNKNKLLNKFEKILLS
tara:strand:- start:400 stop:1584 length:1185 start_codon:yes stop_codon:yes gene_type:complete